MEAYDAAVLSYAIATAAIKSRPNTTGLIGVPSSGTSSPVKETEDNIDPRRYLYQLLFNIEQMVMSKTQVPLSLLMELCSLRQNEEPQILSNLESLLNELRSICKSNPGSINLLFLHFDDRQTGASLNTEKVCKTLSDLFKQFGLQNGSAGVRQLAKKNYG